MDQREQLFENYSQMRDLLRLIRHLPNSDLYQEISRTIISAMNKTTTLRINIAVAGEINRGKSMLVNVISGHEITPVSALPMTTRCDIHVKCGNRERYSLDYGDGAKETDRETFNAALSNPQNTVRSAWVEYPDFTPGTQIELIDTCGLNNKEEESLESVMNADLLIWVLVPDSPISQTESNVLRQWMNRPHGKLLLALNKIDQVDADEDIDRLIESIHDRLGKELQIDLKDTPVFPTSARTATLAQASGESMQSSGVPDLWNAVLMQAGSAAGSRRLHEAESKLDSCIKKLSAEIDAQRQSMINAIQSMKLARTRLDGILTDLTISIGQDYRRILSHEVCARPDMGLQRIMDQLKSAVADAPSGMRNAKRSVIKIASTGRRVCEQVQDSVAGTIRMARDDFVGCTNSHMLQAMNELNVLFEPVNQTLCEIHPDMELIHIDFVAVLDSIQLSMETNMPQLNAKFEEVQLMAVMMLGKETAINRLSGGVEKAFTAWRNAWEKTLADGEHALGRWRDSLRSTALKAFEDTVNPVKEQIQADLEELTGIDLASILAS